MLLEREAAAWVPAVTSLEAIENCYPNVWAELQNRLASPSAPSSRPWGSEVLDDRPHHKVVGS